jgi:hypothetical protein
MRNLDTAIDVSTAYRLDLRAGLFGWHDGSISGTCVARSSVVGALVRQTEREGRLFTGNVQWRPEEGGLLLNVTMNGQPYRLTLADTTPGDRTRLYTLTREDEVVALDLRDFDRAHVIVWRASPSAPGRPDLAELIAALDRGTPPDWPHEAVRAAWLGCTDFDVAIRVLLRGAEIGLFDISETRGREGGDRWLFRLGHGGRFYRIDAHRRDGAEGVRRCFPDFPLDWTPEEARALGEEGLSLWCELLRTLPERPVSRAWSPDALAAIAPPIPDEPVSNDELIGLARRVLFEFATYPGHPRFMGYICGAGTVPGAVADLLAAALNANAGGFRVGPGAITIEMHLTRWFATEVFGLPEGAFGIFTTGHDTFDMAKTMRRSTHAVVSGTSLR